MKFTIITPTTGNSKLSKLIESVNNQTVNENIQIEHLVVIDGPDFYEKVDKILEETPEINHDRFVFKLPYNTGSNNYFGHKVYASISQLTKGDYVLLCDEDNWYEPEHIQSLYDTIKKGDLDWCYSLRKIVSDEGEYVCNDDCESLGYLHHCFYNQGVYMIDTNCTCVKADIIKKISPIWNKQGFNNNDDPDRLYSRLLMTQYRNYDCTRGYTINYRVANRENSVKGELFLKGNEILSKKYDDVIPWHKSERLAVVHFNQENTDKIIQRIYKREKESIAYKQWQLNILDCMNDRFIINGYNPYLPSGTKVLFHMCNPGELPGFVLERDDLEKVLYTIEGPNIRHQQQWSLEFLLKYFTKIITYWEPLIKMSPQLDNRISYFPFIGRFDMNNPNDLACIKENNNVGKKVCIVLEKRDFRGNYSINEVGLEAHDHLRWEYCSNLGKRVYCYGKTWEPFGNTINYVEAKNRFLDEERVIDIMENYTFALIIENCNGDGYVSEKIYDALTVGCIPLYYGNNNARLRIPKDCYIDLREVKPKDLPLLIDSMDDSFIQMFRQNIYKKRMDILKKVSVGNYNNI